MGILVPASDLPKRWAEPLNTSCRLGNHAQLSANAMACARRLEYHSANIGAQFLDLMQERTVR